MELHIIDSTNGRRMEINVAFWNAFGYTEGQKYVDRKKTIELCYFWKIIESALDNCWLNILTSLKKNFQK
jgi:hypothetical protein